jgi:hypothetical protein
MLIITIVPLGKRLKFSLVISYILTILHTLARIEILLALSNVNVVPMVEMLLRPHTLLEFVLVLLNHRVFLLW